MWKYSEEILKGGKGDGKDIDSFDTDQVLKGLKVELEHTTELSIALEIVKDHLTEDPKYYTKLNKMEKGSSANLTNASWQRIAQDSGANLIELAYEFGYSSPNNAPAQDSRLMKLIESNSSKEIGGSIPLMKAWLEGHSDANSESFEEEFKDDEVMNQLPSWGQRFRSKDSRTASTNQCPHFIKNTEQCRIDKSACPYEEDWESCPKLL